MKNWKKYGLLGIIAFIILPTGTPEDLITTVPLIAYLGMTGYLLLCLVLLALIWEKL